MSEIAPLRLAEDWDNVGLLLGNRSAPAARVMTCLTVTPAVVSEAEDENVDLIIAHHPLPFKPMGKINTDSAAGELVWRLCRSGTALYSAHTAYDSAAGGINDQWCEAMKISGLRPLIPQLGSPLPSAAAGGGSSVSSDDTVPLGAGRYGDLPEAVAANEFLRMAAEFSGATLPRLVGDPQRPVRRIGVGCGSGGSFVGAARRVGCDMLLTGEATFHTCLEAENTGLSLALVGHYASERFAMESLARRLQTELASLKPQARMANEAGPEVWASRRERDVIAVDPVSQNP
ncbi:Nif3-like dinuclear metal center hexameric protein [Aporhodopirellula aestuarii]|uniref:Nif3-like dinuclear metal center hexameric protein n=1 Tax=Aporhodopirellula aestuarii TaxID=2950107 RepID=A0ABT0U7V7_9BACT|nr:Nif3-like dinuclear metal center hexameric protein [Aporhodopirellula aestuarii]